MRIATRMAAVFALAMVFVIGASKARGQSDPAAGADDPPPQAEAAPPIVYAIRFLPGPAWHAGEPAPKQPGIVEHMADMASWHDRKILVMCGPFLDSTGGLAVVRVESLEAARELAASDPGVISGLLVPEVHPWLLAFAPGE